MDIDTLQRALNLLSTNGVAENQNSLVNAINQRLARFGSSQCALVTNEIALPMNPPDLTRLLEGTGDEVTALERRQAYDALARSIKHHSVAYDRLDLATEAIFRGMRDRDRSVRLGAG